MTPQFKNFIKPLFSKHLCRDKLQGYLQVTILSQHEKSCHDSNMLMYTENYVATLRQMSRHSFQSFNLRLCRNIYSLCHDIKLIFQFESQIIYVAT